MCMSVTEYTFFVFFKFLYCLKCYFLEMIFNVAFLFLSSEVKVTKHILRYASLLFL